MAVTGTAISWTGPSNAPGVTINNSGTITSGNRGIDTSGANPPRNLTLNNFAGALISTTDDAFRLNTSIGNGTVVINNSGTIVSATGQVFDFAGNTSTTGTVQINNSATGILRALANDVIRPGAGATVITNSGLIDSTASANRAINLNITGNLSVVTSFQLFNNAGGTIQSQDDTVRVTASGTKTTTGSFLVDNSGTISSTGTGQAIDWTDIAGSASNVVINRTGGLITATGNDAVRPGQNGVVENWGTIFANGIVGSGASSDGIDLQGNAGTVINHSGGTISGFRHGITSDANVNVTNEAGATITGRNGSGVGSDGTGTVVNYGRITGAYAGVGDGDGDGVDVDFAATITNYGTIEGTGAGGFDKGGRANNSEGISIGGGTITNYGTISGANYAIVVNNDSNADGSRSGLAATTITNNVGGLIVGQNGFAIRLENKTGTAADNDTIVNYGTIIGNGSIPDPTAIVRLKDGSVDTSSKGTLNGVTYTGTGSARFIRGDGSAIQMGEGNDVLWNYGTIIGNTGRAINLEGGNDTLHVMAGSRIQGLVDGGVGTDTLDYNKVGLSEAKRAALLAGQTVNIGGTLYTSFEVVTGTVRSFSSYATSGAGLGVATLFDNGSTSIAASPAMAALIDSVASAPDVGAALSQLSPAAYQGLARFGIAGAQQATSLVGQHLTDARLNGSSVNLGGASAAMAMFNDGLFSRRGSLDRPFANGVDGNAADAFGAVMPGTGDDVSALSYAKAPIRGVPQVADTDRGLFVNSSLTFARQGARTDAPATKSTTANVVIGTDWRIADRWLLGVFGGFARTTGDLDSLGSKTGISTGTAGVYGSYQGTGWFATAMALYGWSDYDNTRVALGSANLSSFSGTHYAARGTIGTDLRFGNWLVTPEIGVQYINVRLPGFTETGPAALAVGSDESDSLRSSLGARFAYDYRFDGGTITPEVRLAWQHEFRDGVRNITASFVDASFPGSFTTTTGIGSRDLGVFGTGVSGKLGPLTTVSLNYDAIVGTQDAVAHQVTGRLRHAF